MNRSQAEQEMTKRLEKDYVRLQSPVMLAMERRVCGCGYGGNSWTTKREAETILELLGLEPGIRFLDVGSGAGWPGLYMAKQSGCELFMVDLPLAGLKIAAERADRDHISENCLGVCADAGQLPFPDAGFHAISHSDLLCCLLDKRAVLESCRRVARKDGRMVFTVIHPGPGLNEAERTTVIDCAPEFVESEQEYPLLLENTGWRVLEHRDVTAGYGASCRRQDQAEKDNREALIAIIGEEDYSGRQSRWQSKLAVLDSGQLRRSLFAATPA